MDAIVQHQDRGEEEDDAMTTDELKAWVERLARLADEWDAKGATYDGESATPTKNDDDRRTALAKFTAGLALRDCAKALRAAFGAPTATAHRASPPCPEAQTHRDRAWPLDCHCRCAVPGCQGRAALAAGKEIKP